MTKNKHKKRFVRARMAKTGESYQSAARAIERTVTKANAAEVSTTAKIAFDSQQLALEANGGTTRVGKVIAGRFRVRELVTGAQPELDEKPADLRSLSRRPRTAWGFGRHQDLAQVQNEGAPTPSSLGSS
jgi:hypothetical protein